MLRLALRWQLSRRLASIPGALPAGDAIAIAARAFSASRSLLKKQMPPRPTLDPADIDGSYLKGSGPGGQKINKTNSAVQLIHRPTGIVVKCQQTRSRSQNQKLAMQILAEKVDLLARGEESRAAVVRATAQRRKASRARKSRRKYRRLEEEKGKGVMEGEEEADQEGEGEEVHDGTPVGQQTAAPQ